MEGQTVAVMGTGYTVGAHIVPTVEPDAPLSEVVAADGTISFTVGPIMTAGTYTVSVVAHMDAPGSEACGSVAATVTVAAAAATPAPPGATPAPPQPGTGSVPNVAMSAPGLAIDPTALGLVLLTSAAALSAVQLRRQRTR